ncbi:MAG: hypothetical protein ABH950_02020 [Candidatus Altiarchaeota archaeon]
MGSSSGYLASELLDNTTSCTDVAKFNQGTGSWDQYSSAVGLGDYNIEVGVGYFVACDSTDSLSISGTPPGVVSHNLTSGWNLLGWTNSSMNTTAAAVCSGLTYCTDVAKYNRGTRSWDQYNVVVGLGDFDITTGVGYFIMVTDSTTWTR